MRASVGGGVLKIGVGFWGWVDYKKQRMNKFKFQPPQEQRRSVQQRFYDVGVMNTLDRCTQIIREDRLFLRGEIINGNVELIDMIKKCGKSSQLQQLQVRLRKYVQGIKNRIKSEQLNKFKETLKSVNIAPQLKRENSQQKSFLSTLKSQSRQGHQSDLNRSESTRNIKSQDHYSSHPLQSNNSVKHFQELLKLKYNQNQEVIEERQSENVTSARQGRYETEQNKGKPLNEQLFDSIENRLAGKVNRNLLPSKSSDKFYRSTEKEKFCWQQKAKKTLYGKAANNTIEIEEIQKSLCRKTKEDKMMDMESLEESIYDQHFNDSKSSINQNEPNHTDSKSINGFMLKDSLSSYVAKAPPKVQQSASNYYTQQSKTQPIDANRVESDRKSQENLFTPLDLLNQCRNFLKNRQSSNSKPTGPAAQQKQASTANFKAKPLFSKTQQQDPLPSAESRTPTLPCQFSIQNFLECLMQLTQMQPFVTPSVLMKFVNLHENIIILKIILREELERTVPTCLTQLAAKISNYYNKTIGVAYPQNDKQILSVYNLLDVDQKGYICQQDIKSFLDQIQQAQVDNYLQVKQQLQRLFSGADFSNQQRITYWHFYLIKESEQFSSVKQLLDGFDFEFERDD